METSVTVGLPTYNGATYLRECLDSILQQTLRDYEVVIVDDCSTDETYEIARQYERQHPRITLHRNETRLGLVGNFNRCIDLAQGKYICIFGQDDVMLPDNLGEKADLLERHPRVGMVYSNVYHIDGRGEALRENSVHPFASDGISDGIDFFHKLIEDDNFVRCPSVLVRKQCYDRVGGYLDGLFYTCDWEMWLRLALYYDVAYLSIPLMKYRMHSQNETSRVVPTPDRFKQHWLAKKLVLSRHGHRIPNAQKIRRAVRGRISGKALARALVLFRHHKPFESKEFLRAALRINPSLLKNPVCLKLATKLVVGDRGVQAYRTLRSILPISTQK